MFRRQAKNQSVKIFSEIKKEQSTGALTSFTKLIDLCRKPLAAKENGKNIIIVCFI